MEMIVGTRHALCGSVVNGKSRVTDWRFVGIKKLHELPEVLQAKTKTSSQNNLKNFLTSYLKQLLVLNRSTTVWYLKVSSLM